MTMRLLTITAIAFCMGTNAMANDYKVGSSPAPINTSRD